MVQGKEGNKLEKLVNRGNLFMESQSIDFDPRRALPAGAYRDLEWLAAEKAGIWHGDWVFVGTEDALSSPGDQLPVFVGDQPVLLLRNQSGDLVALSNLCAHRGTLLVEGRTNSPRIQCPYHAWTYDDTGRLIGVPYASADAMDRSAHCLPNYRVEAWHGLVFVSLNPSAEPLASRFTAIESHVAERGIDRLQHRSEFHTSEVWECNWKIAITNAMESYHLFKVHTETLEPFSPTSGAYYITGSARATATGGTRKGEDDYLLVSLPPGFVGVLLRGGFVWLAVHPLGTHRCTVRTGGAFASSRQSLLGKLGDWFGWASADSGQMDFLTEDKAICERIQRGVTGDFTPGQLLPVERVVEDFGHYLHWRINQVEPPAPL